MVRYGLIGFAVATLVAASLVPDDAFARRAGGGGVRAGGGFHGGAMRAGGGYHGGAVRAGGAYGGRGYGVAGGPRPSHPVAGRPGYAGRPIAGVGRPIAGYPGRYPWRGAAYGAAAVGAAAAGTYSYYNNYNNGCTYDANNNWVCPGQYYDQY